MVDAIDSLADELDLRRRILPGFLATAVDDDWLHIHAGIAEVARERRDSADLISTVALSADALRDEPSVERVVEAARSWPVGGFYVVAEAPSAYLVEDPIWLANLMVLAGGLRLHGAEVIVGYGNHQLLPLATCGISAIASGTWLNVRTFQPDKFFVSTEDEISRRAKGGWYYSPQALSEYKMPFLDVAMRRGCLDVLAPQTDAAKQYGEALFSGAMPTGIEWGEKNAFRHYLTSLREQTRAGARSSFGETVVACRQQLDDAEGIVTSLRANGVLGQDRDFTNYFDVGRAAITILETALGPRLSRGW